MTSIFPFIGSATIFIIVAIAGLEICKKRKILDRPGPDVPARPRVPNMQGIFLLLGFFIVTAVFFPTYYNQPLFQGLVYGGAFIMLFSVADTVLDSYFKKGIKAKYRLILQVVAALIAFGIGGVGLHEFVLPGNSPDSVFTLFTRAALIITVLWFVGFMNAINWFDGIYGLASGTSTIGFLTIYLLLQQVVLPAHMIDISPENLTAIVIATNTAFVLALGGLVYTIIEYKPTGLLRDIGILFYGYALAYLALLGGAKIGTVLVALSLPIFDAVWVFINRIFVMKKNPMKKDYTHLHYRLMGLGWTRGEVRWFVRGWSIFFMILMILQGTNRGSKVIIFLLMTIIFFGVNIYLFWVKKLPMEYVPPKKDGNSSPTLK